MDSAHLKKLTYRELQKIAKVSSKRRKKTPLNQCRAKESEPTQSGAKWNQ
jgi:hypothetical protein